MSCGVCSGTHWPSSPSRSQASRRGRSSGRPTPRAPLRSSTRFGSTPAALPVLDPRDRLTSRSIPPRIRNRTHGRSRAPSKRLPERSPHSTWPRSTLPARAASSTVQRPWRPRSAAPSSRSSSHPEADRPSSRCGSPTRHLRAWRATAHEGWRVSVCRGSLQGLPTEGRVAPVARPLVCPFESPAGALLMYACRAFPPPTRCPWSEGPSAP